MTRSLFFVLALMFGVLGATPAMAGPMIDPKEMSGIPRPDPQIAAGELTVRVLRGSFDSPVLDATVELELRSGDGRTAELRTAVTVNQGRAYFRELEPFIGGQAVARVVVDGETLRSQQIDLLPQSGSAVMLVKGAPQGKHPAQQISLPGILFDFDRTPVGTLAVIVFDLKAGKGIGATEVRMMITTPDGQQTARSVNTDGAGLATFDGMAELPADAVLQVAAQLQEGEPHRSQTFTTAEVQSKGKAIWLAKGKMGRKRAGGQGQGAQGGQGAHGQRQRIPPPQIARDLPVGTLQVMVVDGSDRPVVDQLVTIIKKDFSGTEKRFEVQTNAQGIAVRSDLPLAVNDGLYYVGVPYDGAPYTSAFFGMDKRGGVRVGMRVYEVTNDLSVAKSAVQWEIIEGENDHAQVVQVYEVLISGDKAFWPGKGMRIEGLEGAKSMVVLRGAEEWLEHEEKAPYATISHPLAPGEVAALSLGYVIEHDGEIEFDWVPPFELMESAIVLPSTHTLDANGSSLSDRELPEQRGLDYVRVPYELGNKGKGTVQFRVTGLKRTEQMFRQIGIAGGAVLALVLLMGVMMRPRGDARERLTRRRDELLAALSTRKTKAQRQRVIAALDRVYRQLDALEEVPAPAKPKAKPAKSA